ncbi:MAG: hypothetical protein M3P23_08750 [Actinomycetota bacterium]|nr:hypothetical protein [Actinomycetota bacterium]
MAEARSVLAKYETAKNQADSQLAGSLLRQYETGPVLATDLARYKIASGLHHGGQESHVTYRDPQIYIPRLAAYPYWFIVVTARSNDKENKAEYLVFERSSVTTGWKLALAPTGFKGASVPHVVTDREGHAMPVSKTAPLAIAPGKIAAAHADLLTVGTKSATTARLNLDQTTAQLLKQNADETSSLAATATSAHSYRPASDGLYCALRTEGGALVIYATTSVVEITGRGLAGIQAEKEIETLAGVSGYFSHASSTGVEQFAAFIPASGKATVLGHAGALTGAALRGRLA